MHKILYALIPLFGLVGLPAQAAGDVADQFASQFNVARTLAAQYEQEARKHNKHAKLSAEAGRAFYVKKVMVDGKDTSCSACHTDNPTKVGQHNETKKAIDPMAISANPDRFSDVKKVEKNFAKHCMDLYKKDCSAQDKGDLLTYLLTVK
ncbi:MAG: DUF1924 domain-containing protein [Sideroxydans sp.]